LEADQRSSYKAAGSVGPLLALSREGAHVNAAGRNPTTPAKTVAAGKLDISHSWRSDHSPEYGIDELDAFRKTSLQWLFKR
jgi:hypothetical protein